MKTVDPKSRQMKLVLMFRTHLIQHSAWRRPHHDNPSPATWSRRRLHHAISCPGGQPDRSSAIRPTGQRRPLRRPVCASAIALPQTPAPHRLGPSRADRPWQRQLPAQPDLHNRHVHQTCPTAQAYHRGHAPTPADPRSPAAATGPGPACRCTESTRARCDHGRYDHLDAARQRRFGASTSHRTRARRSAATSLRSEPLNFVPFIITPGGVS